jgi:hypothetical protein
MKTISFIKKIFFIEVQFEINGVLQSKKYYIFKLTDIYLKMLYSTILFLYTKLVYSTHKSLIYLFHRNNP